MIYSLIKKLGVASAFVMSVTFLAFSQEKASPAKTAEGTINGAKITINYGSPSAKGRDIWGGLVPYDKVWRAGANEATTFETSKDIKVEGENLPAGKYSLFIIPNPNKSTLIFNKQTGQWGTQYDESQDQLKVSISGGESSSYEEQLTYEVLNDGIEIRWAEAKGKVKIE
ncbi:DUF2911 domain-containing protein [Pleomorphovibrio marinus]|uniref:DUF2911 domain-containing protein n=1 Tax=Pleomorphovibrio marinus TaxID=2164132 RepID=UPI000E0B5BF9|nr:DUF2911 domain-containing protein [Pleomorphovibrio marinus]